jgi:hypothetical protein
MDRAQKDVWNQEGCPKHQKKKKCCVNFYCLACPKDDEDSCENDHARQGRIGRRSRDEDGTETVSRVRPTLSRSAHKSDGSYAENPVLRRTGFAALLDAMGALEDAPVDLKTRQYSFSQQAVIGTQGPVARSFAHYLFERMAISLCDENPALIKSIMLEKWSSEGVPTASETVLERVFDCLADLSARSIDMVTRRCFLLVLYHFLPRKKVGTLLKNARERIPTNCPDDVRSNRGIGYKAERQAQLDIGVIMRFDELDGSSRHSKLKPENLEIWKTFIIDQLEGLRPSRLQNRLKIGAHAVLRNVPYFIRTVELQTLFRKYRAWCLSRQITSSRMLGNNTFCQLTPEAPFLYIHLLPIACCYVQSLV